jgi:hypothetical protein
MWVALCITLGVGYSGRVSRQTGRFQSLLRLAAHDSDRKNLFCRLKDDFPGRISITLGEQTGMSNLPE